MWALVLENHRFVGLRCMRKRRTTLFWGTLGIVVQSWRRTSGIGVALLWPGGIVSVHEPVGRWLASERLEVWPGS